LSADLVGEAADMAAQAAEPHSDHRGSAANKRHLVGVFTSRILSGLINVGEEEAA
jgi:carbon-monoxide dehydrogenase medium subunit